MELSVETRYWRRQWLTPLAFCLMNALALAFQIWEETKSGQPIYLKPAMAVFAVDILVVLLCFFVYSLSKSIRRISIAGGKVVLVRRLGRMICADIQKVAIYNDVLCIGKYFTIRLDGMVNKEQVKDMLAGHVNTHPKDTRTIHTLANILTALLIILSVSFLALILLSAGQSPAGGWTWAYIGFVSAFSIGFVAWTAGSLAMK